MTNDVRNFLLALSAWVLAVLVVRLAGQFIAGHAVAAWKRHRRKHKPR